MRVKQTGSSNRNVSFFSGLNKSKVRKNRSPKTFYPSHASTPLSARTRPTRLGRGVIGSENTSVTTPVLQQSGRRGLEKRLTKGKRRTVTKTAVGPPTNKVEKTKNVMEIFRNVHMVPNKGLNVSNSNRQFVLYS